MSTTEQPSVPARPRRTPLQRGLLAAGLLLIAGGLGLLGWISWEMWGTTWVSERKQDAAVEEIVAGWEAGRNQVDVPAGTAAYVVRIPRFGADYAIPVLEGTEDDALESGFGHFLTSQDPGARGNFALAGHRITHGEPLRRMPELQPGDEVVVETREWVYTYVLDTGGDDLVVPFSGVWVLDRRPVNPSGGPQPPADRTRLITLTTCAELFHTDDRLIAFGHLQSRRPRV